MILWDDARLPGQIRQAGVGIDPDGLHHQEGEQAQVLSQSEPGMDEETENREETPDVLSR